MSAGCQKMFEPIDQRVGKPPQELAEIGIGGKHGVVGVGRPWRQRAYRTSC